MCDNSLLSLYNKANSHEDKSQMNHLLGLFLDITGTVIIGFAVLNLHTHLRRLNRRELEEDL